jgi:hypothetical protein
MLKYLCCALLFAATCGAAFDVAGPNQEGSRKSLMQAAGRAVQAPPEPIDLTHTPPVEVRKWRGDGSCVQCSLGINGVRRNNIKAATLLWDTIYGPPILGGSDVTRVSKYCRERNIPIYNVTGKGTLKWAEWAADTGRGAAIWFGELHFQTLMGRDKAQGIWYVCNNNNPAIVKTYSDSDFRRIHVNSGQWIVVLDGPVLPPPPTIPAKS